MRIVSVSDEFFDLCGDDRELMTKRGRPCVLVLRLRYKGKHYDFAAPFRSNIAPNVPKNQYFALPPRPTTKPHHRHGIHYIKMFPISRRFVRRFRTEGNPYYQAIQQLIDRNTAKIVKECQAYLNRYEKEGRPSFAVDIDGIIDKLSL